MSSLTLTLVQTSLHWEDRPANLAHLEQLIMGIEGTTELVILPELFSTGFSMKPEFLSESMQGTTVNWMKKRAAERNIILTGSVMIEEAHRYYNRLLWVLPNGEFGYYDKRHLFGFAGENEHYTAGTRRLVATVKGWRILLLVCYDLRFPVWSRQTADASKENPEPEYDLIIYVANWPERRNHAWKTLLQARAIENQCYVAAVNRIGNDGHSIYHKIGRAHV